jgi:hypothetical protein
MAIIGQNYMLSLPERAIRSAAALIGGTSLLLTEMLLPDVLRETTTYRITIGDLQKFLITRLAQVPPAEQALQERMSDAYLRKKVVGGTMEAIGLLTMRFSPVWVFAIAGDAAGGSKVFLHRLVDNLKENAVIDQESDPGNLVELLDAVQASSYGSAKAIDTPPLSQEELAAVADDLTSRYGKMFSSGQPFLLQFESIWERMERVAFEQDLSFEQLSGLMATNASSLGKTGLAVSQTGAELFGEKVLNSYRRTLDEISRQGISGYVNRSMLPFLEAAVSHFDPDKSTWTESSLLQSPK